MAVMDRAEIERQVAAAERRRRQAAERLAQNEQRLRALEEERAALEGDAVLARRGIEDFGEHLARLHEELRVVEVEEAKHALADAVRGRDQAVGEAAGAVAATLLALEGLQAARAAVQEAEQRLEGLDRDTSSSIPPESDQLDEPWEALVSVVRQESELRLERDLVEAAARSSNALAIEELPEHLRELARQRWRARRAEAAPNRRRLARPG
jgi:hypothetical protein